MDSIPIRRRAFQHLCGSLRYVRGDDDGCEEWPQAREYIDRLNRDFGNVREIPQHTEPSLAASLIEPVIDRFTESLDALASIRTDLAARCESLAGNVAELLKPADPDSTGESDVWGIRSSG